MLRAESPIGVFVERNSIAFRDALKESTVARRALRVQPEVSDRLLAQQHDFYVASADIANHVGVGEEVQSTVGMGDGFDHRHIGAEDVLQQVLAVTGDR